jgi:hypothetical protein
VFPVRNFSILVPIPSKGSAVPSHVAEPLREKILIKLTTFSSLASGRPWRSHRCVKETTLEIKKYLSGLFHEFYEKIYLSDSKREFCNKENRNFL